MGAERVISEAERRKYIRLNSVFPVLFRVSSVGGQECLSGWQQGFTSNIGKGGICLDVNILDPDTSRLIKGREVKISLVIEVPMSKSPINAVAGISWIKEADEGGNKYFIGLSYEQINQVQNNKLFRFARTKKIFPAATAVIFILLALGFTLNTFLNIRLIQDNRTLVQELVKILQQTSLAEQKIKDINRDKEDLQLKIATAQLRIQALEEEKTKRRKEEDGMVNNLNDRIKNLTQEKSNLQEQFISLQRKESAITNELLRLDKNKTMLAELNFDKMYQWLKKRQAMRTGLIRSAEGEGGLSSPAFTYDQSLAIQVYAYFSDFERAGRIMDFFNRKAKKKNGMFFNTYNTNIGGPMDEVAYSGPNIWLGVAIVQYTRKSRDNKYFRLAEEIADNLINLQRSGKGGGIRGGPDLNWYLPEHNLDAYAFFNMLYQVTGKAKYEQARDKVLSWLMTNFNNQADIEIRRKRGDSTIVANTQMWAVVAIGPERLEALGINPERILESAEENFAAELSYTRPEGQTIKIKGFDFAPKIHSRRGGVVFSEWTAQFVIAFQNMADFYLKKQLPAKARAYEMKANEYKSELSKMIISSSSPASQGESCLPYATADSVYTGHGWITPKGKTTGSVSGTAYTIFAYYKYNPLDLQ